MKIINPQISKELNLIEDFVSYAQEFLIEEIPITAIKTCDEQMEGAELFKVEVQKSIFENCIFHNCSFENASFVDIIFLANV